MDLQMPVMDGLTATREIRAAGGRAGSIPIIALTASAFEEERRECEAAGMNDHLAKPVGIEALRRMINRHGNSDTLDAALPAPVRSPMLEQRITARLRQSGERLTAIKQDGTHQPRRAGAADDRSADDRPRARRNRRHGR